MANNPQLYNAALSGATGAAKVNRWITDQSSASYAADRNAAVALATAVDAAIPINTNLNTFAANLVESITAAVIADKNITATLNSSAIALSIAALYNSLAPQLLPVGPQSAGPSYYVADFGAVGDGIADDTAAINRAIAAANTLPGPIYLMRRHRVTAALTPLANNNIIMYGRGEFNGGTILTIDATVLPTYVLQVNGSQYCGFVDIWCVSTRASATGFFIGLTGAYRPICKNIQVSGYGNGIEIDRCVGTYLERCQVNDIYGRYCFYVHGVNPNFCHDTYFNACNVGANYLLTVTGTPGSWATGTVYNVGNIVLANGAIWQCSTAGTSAGAGTGPSGLPSTNPSTVHTVTVADNTVQWRFVMGAFSGYTHGSFAHTVTLFKCGCLQGDIGLEVADDAPAAGSVPTFNHSWQFSADHPFSRGVKLSAGAALWFDELLVTSLQAGDGIEVASGCSGVEFNSGQIFGCAQNGLTYAGTGGMVIQNFDIGPCSSRTANTFDGIAIANNAGNFKISHCTSGDVTGFATSARYGISIGTGCNNFQVDFNDLVGNDTGPILCNVALTKSEIIRHNNPEAAYYDATDGVSKQSLAAGVQTLNVPSGTHTVIITPQAGGTVILDAIIHADVVLGLNSGIRLRIIKEGTTGVVALRDGNASANSIWPPNSVDYTLARFNDAVEVVQCQTAQLSSVRWRVLARSTPTATVSVVVPAVAAGQVGYVDTNVSATALGGITTADVVCGNPTADLVAAGAGGGYINSRVSATNTIRSAFVGPLAGGASNFVFTKVSYVGQ